jgi:hypothetical protein
MGLIGLDSLSLGLMNRTHAMASLVPVSLTGSHALERRTMSLEIDRCVCRVNWK